MLNKYKFPLITHTSDKKVSFLKNSNNTFVYRELFNFFFQIQYLTTKQTLS